MNFSSTMTEQQSTSETDLRYSIGLESQTDASAGADPQILEALKSGKDRIFVLKLGEQMEALIQERK